MPAITPINIKLVSIGIISLIAISLLLGKNYLNNSLNLATPMSTLIEQVQHNKAPTRSAWLWRDPRSMTSDEITGYLDLSTDNNIGTIYLSIDHVVPILLLEESVEKQRQLAEFSQALDFFVTQASDREIKIEGLAGENYWSEPSFHHIPLQLVEFISTHNQQETTSAPIIGLHLDVEYHTTSGFSPDQTQFALDYLTMVEKIVSQINTINQTANPPLFLALDIPFWFGREGTYPQIVWAGEKKYLSDHLTDILDTGQGNTLVLMAYRDNALGVDGTVVKAADEISYAQDNQKKTLIVVGQETTNAEPNTSFYGMPKAYFQEETAKIDEYFREYDSYGGIAIHDLSSFGQLK